VTKSNSDGNNVTTTRHNSALKINWENMIDQSVHTTDDVDIGDIDALP
jgi:hypothetical protein